MNPILIVVPTLNRTKGENVGKLALTTAGCSVPVRVVVVHDVKRVGFTKVANKGMRASHKDEDICLLNDDVTEFQPGWLETLRKVLYLNSKYGLSGPSGKSAAAPMKEGGPGQSGTLVVNIISFWCVLMKRAMLKELGYLDEVYIHYCSDTGYCRRMKESGWRCVWAKAVYLNHQYGASGYKKAWHKHDRKIYLSRWGKGGKRKK